MENEKAKRFLEAARKDYEHAVFWYCMVIEAKADGPESIASLRAAVLAAQQVLELAQRELDDVQRHERRGKDYTGVCEECGRTAPRWLVGDSLHLRALCAECGRAD